MPLLASYKQQPADRVDYDIWFANDPDGAPDWLPVGDFLDSVEVIYPEGITIVHMLFPDRVKLWVTGGTSGTAYKVTVTAHTVDFRSKQVELRFRIKDE